MHVFNQRVWHSIFHKTCRLQREFDVIQRGQITLQIVKQHKKASVENRFYL